MTLEPQVVVTREKSIQEHHRQDIKNSRQRNNIKSCKEKVLSPIWKETQENKFRSPISKPQTQESIEWYISQPESNY